MTEPLEMFNFVTTYTDKKISNKNLVRDQYGSIVANWLCNPTAAKLKINHDAEMMIRDITVEGLLSIQAGENPRIIEEKLKSFLAPSARDVQTDDAGGGEA